MALERRVEELEQKMRELEQKNLAMQDKNRKMKQNIEAYREKHKKARRAAGQKTIAASTTGEVPGKNKRSGKPRGKRGAGFKVQARSIGSWSGSSTSVHDADIP